MTIDLSASDPEGSGVKEIVYSASGAQAIPSTTNGGSTAQISIASEGITTVSFAARDNAENLESEQQLVVQIDTTAPGLSGVPTSAPNAEGWHNGSVTIDWSCHDDLSGLAGDCPADTVVSGEGADQSASVSVTDRAGNQTSSSVTGINIDRTTPETTISTAAGWSNAPVTVSLTATDNLSGVATTYYVLNDGPQQTGGEVIIADSGVHTVRYWSVDAAGNTEPARTAEFKVDRVTPSISYRLSSPANAAGWHREPVTITFECADSPSGIASCTDAQTIATDGANQAVTGTAIDNAGNSATSTAYVNVDQTAPRISASPALAANADGWNNTNVVVTFTCSDALSGIANCPDPVTVVEGEGQSVTGITTDKAGNSASAGVSDLNVDLTDPTISVTATVAGKPYIEGTWVNQPVTVTFACSDALSGIASCPDSRVITEGAGQSVTGTAFDVAGNSAGATVSNINVDISAPTIISSLTTMDDEAYTPGTWAGQAVTVTFVCGDALSGVATCTTPQTLVNGANQSVSGTVVDAAGNSVSLTVDDIDVDLVGPTIIATATTADGATYVPGTWTNQTVTVSFTCADDGSGLAGPCPGPVVIDASTPAEGRPVSAQIGDLAGLTATSPVLIVKVDKDAPVFTSVPFDQVAEATSADGAVVSWADLNASDAIAGSITPVCSSRSGAVFPLGETTVTCTATDPAGNVATVTFVVTVEDAPLPELTVPEPIVVPADSPAGAVVTYQIASGDARVASQPECAPKSGSRFRVGTTTVTCSATNGTGQTATASFTVTVVGAADLLRSLRSDTVALVTNRAHERLLLRPLDQAQQAMKAGNPLAAYLSMVRYRVQVALYLRYRYISPDVYRELQRGAEWVTNAMM